MECVACSTDCEECFQAADNCVSCDVDAGYVLVIDYNEGTCETNCPEPQEPVNGVCSGCPTTTPYSYAGLCIEACGPPHAEHTYAMNNVCIDCPADNCQTCDAGGCVTC